jgi:type II secretory ATPase GspE/PulE/Tfp pilus assembly ATPase PilB-like protein
MEKSEIRKRLEEETRKHPEEASIVQIVSDLILYGIKIRASDIHIQPEEKELVIRFRVDGVMHNIFFWPRALQNEIISRIKVLANLRTDEHFAAQDGRFRFVLQEENLNFDVRVSIIPTYYGENAVLRLLTKTEAEEFTLENLGFSERDLREVKRAIKKPYGMILSTGPTGSGKTTTLYTILQTLNTENVSIVTLEDPIEYSLPGITQIQVNPQTGITFDNGLRSILRQDPDIIMVGEIRDKETASIAVNAALTGHLLLSTLHTNDAPTAIPRLLDMGIEPFLVASTLNLVIGQRLVRKICSYCRKERKMEAQYLKSLEEQFPEIEKFNLEKAKFYYGEGCQNCDGTGYIGRIGIFEVLPMSSAVREAVSRKFTSAQIKEIARKEGMTTMLEDGFKKVISGITTIEEVLRVMHE